MAYPPYYQVCGAKQRHGHAVHPALEQKTTIHILFFSVVRVRRAKEINQPIRPSFCG
jgi:hypothetical protein